MATKRIKRKVVKVERLEHFAGVTLTLVLECGHDAFRKGSQGVPEFVYCRECGAFASGSVLYVRRGDVVETWDAARQMPVFTEAPESGNG